MKCQYCEATTDLTERTCVDGQTRVMCAECIRATAWWCRWATRVVTEINTTKKTAA
jgi:hypothetical protein